MDRRLIKLKCSRTDFLLQASQELIDAIDAELTEYDAKLQSQRKPLIERKIAALQADVVNINQYEASK